MILEHLKLRNIRCYSEIELTTPDPHVNVITGLNGEGKTSILEAIGLLAMLRSFRNAKNSEIIKIGHTEAWVTGRVKKQDLEAILDVKIMPHGKQGTLNGKSCKYFSEYLGKLSAVCFSPDDLEIIRGSPENRRIWIDKVAQIFFLEHVDVVLRYNKILQHRNKQLKKIAEGKQKKQDEDFEIWTEQLCQWGSKIIQNRLFCIEKIVSCIQKYYEQISHQKINITIRYLSKIFNEVSYGQPDSLPLKLIYQALKDSIESSRQKEQILGTTIIGPHRDDLSMEINKNELRLFGSQGEIRSFVLAMRLSEVELYQSKQGVIPLLLLDDFSSELDSKRRSFLLDYLSTSSSQVFLSTTENLSLGKNFLVRQAKVYCS